MKILIKYYHRKALLSIDLSTLFTLIFDTYSNEVSITFSPMSTNEQKESSQLLDHGIVGVNDLFHLLEVQEEDVRRRKDLEQEIIRIGHK
jgi:hypothetical protein